MQPLTNERPKPMIEFHGRPFLEYLVEMLRDQGIPRILLLLGYLPEVVQRYFGDGSGWGVEIDYSITEPDDLTVSRVQVAEERIEPTFMLLYCDNYWPLQLDRMWRRYRELGAPAMVTVYSNKDDYRPGRGGVAVDERGFVTSFDKRSDSAGGRGVEISYSILDKSVLDLLPEQDELIETALYPQLARRGELSAFVSDHRYYSVGSLERLPMTERFLARHPTVILDRDGVLNERPPRAEYVKRPEEFEWLPGAREALAMLKEAGYRTLVVSNQAGIARGAMSEADLRHVEARMKAEAVAAGGSIDATYYCPHDWDEGCECRKPAPGMLFQAQREFDLDLTRTTFIGDDERDGEAAEAAGCPFIRVDERTSLLDAVSGLLGHRARAVAR
jgi:histidinol-phosphate phosphatase family protein